MSEHRRKPPQGRGRRAAQQPPSPPSSPPPPSGRGAAVPPPPAQPPRAGAGSGYGQGGGAPYGGPRPTGTRTAQQPAYGSRADARRTAQGAGNGGGRRRAAGTGVAAGMAGHGGPDGPAGRSRRAPKPPSAHRRFVDYPRADRYGARRWLPSFKQVLGVCVGFLALVMGLAGVAYAMVGTPNVADIPLAQKNVYYWKDGSRMVTAGGGEENRQIVPLDKIPLHLQQAVIAAENETFYEDSGVDPSAILKAAGRMAMGGELQSGSTITQQFVKNTVLKSQALDRGPNRKVKELLISVKIGAEMSKQDILAGYFNSVPFGRGVYGVQAASRSYFDEDVDKLNPSQTAFLAAIVNGPDLHDPHGGQEGIPGRSPQENTERMTDRWSWILNREVEVGAERMKQNPEEKWLTREEADGYLEKGLPKSKPPKRSTDLGGQIGYMVKLANNYLTSNTERTNITEEDLERGGLEIHTTFDKDQTEALEKTVRDERKKRLNAKREEDKHVQFGGASVVPGDGAIRAIYGGESALVHWTNNADATGASVGSTFKPFVMAAALEYGKRDPQLDEEQSEGERTPVSPESIYIGTNKTKLLTYQGETWLNEENKPWRQRNDGDQSYGKQGTGEMTLREAMKVSANTPFIQLGMDVGTDKVKEAALAAGLGETGMPKDRSPHPAFSLGISSPSAIRLATGYATFAASGEQADPYSVTKVEQGGTEVYEHVKKTKRAFDPAIADTVTSMLQDVVSDGTGTYVYNNLGNRPAAGKTGTTDGNKHAWFVGYTPQMSTAIGMWRMSDQEGDKRDFLEMYGTAGEPQIHGGDIPAEIWTAYMKKALAKEQPASFPEPAPYGTVVYGTGVPKPEPKPEPEPTPSEKPSTPPATPSPSQPSMPTPSPSRSCIPFIDPKCKETGGMDGGQDAGQDAGQTGGNPGGTTGGDVGGADEGQDAGQTGGADKGQTGGSDAGGLFNGGQGTQPRKE